jgi:hypothetical protein
MTDMQRTRHSYLVHLADEPFHLPTLASPIAPAESMVPTLPGLQAEPMFIEQLSRLLPQAQEARRNKNYSNTFNTVPTAAHFPIL